MAGMAWRSGLAAVAAAALVCIAMTAVSMSERRVELLQDGGDTQADFKAVGDLGCLGRKCEMSDDASRKDLDNFFGNFLNHGQHAGHHSRTFGLAPEHVRLSDKEGRKDLLDYYGKQKSGVTAKVRGFEKRSSSQLDQFPDTDSRSDMSSFYDTLPGAGKKQNIVDQENRAEKAAKQHQLKALAAAQASHRRMTEQHAETEEQAVRDHEKFQKAGKQQLRIQEAGHRMEAVPSSPRTDTSERRAEGRYFQQLQVEAEAEKQKDARRHAGEHATASKHKLSAQAAKDDMDQWYSQLNSKVEKTPRVVQSEAEARKEAAAARKFRQTPLAKGERDVGAAVPTKHFSRAQEQKADAAYFNSLNAQVHKTKIVREAEARARTPHTLSAAAARRELDKEDISQVGKRAQVVAAEKQAKAGFEHMQQAAKKADAKAAAAVTSVPAAVKDGKLTRQAALQGQDAYFAKLDAEVHKSPRVLAAERAAKRGKARRSLSAEEARKELLGR